MRVKEVMSSAVCTIDPETTLETAATRMKEHDIGLLPVVEDEKVVALLTDRDLVTRAVAAGRSPSSQVRDVMTPKVWTIHEDDALEEAAKTMKAKRVRRLVVLDREERPVGIATLGDLAHHGETAEIGGDVLRSISEPANPQRISDRQEALPAFARVVRT